jgi:hypothetical protein
MEGGASIDPEGKRPQAKSAFRKCSVTKKRRPRERAPFIRISAGAGACPYILKAEDVEFVMAFPG